MSVRTSITPEQLDTLIEELSRFGDALQKTMKEVRMQQEKREEEEKHSVENQEAK